VSIGAHRLLGFAFATADLFIEISPEGRIAFAMGASEALAGADVDVLVGRPWRDFIDPADGPMVEALFEGLDIGLRGGPALVRLAKAPDGVDRAVSLSVFRLPQNGGALSCALCRANPENAPKPGELHDREGFEALAGALLQTAQSTGADLELALIELDGLSSVRDAAAPDARIALDTRLAGVLRAQAHGGAAATELGEDRFALVRARGEGTDTLVRRLARLMNAGLADEIRPSAGVMSLKTEGQSRQTVRALRYSLDSFLRDGHADPLPANLGEALGRAMERTLQDVGTLGSAIRERRFRLVYQPVVRLKDRTVHHYETLVRFGDQESPFPLIRMAEEMELIEPLDIAILETAVDVLAQTTGLKLAVNVSGRTITSSDFVEHACRLIGKHPTVRGRLMFELTESAALDDLALADRHLQALRDQGCEICLDDFGAGAASLAYLQQLRLDVLKIDGRYIRDLQHGGREATFVKHLVKMCADMGVRTLAEMVETPAAEDAVRRAGVDMAQGWLYGAAAERPEVQPPAAQTPARIRPALSR
jgi:EAL domain-containing protein (putative c-di-GMP-specific phosphodiesterase class I)/GGDEF domain-containing protein